jgi:addiction module HigA family antidote
MTEERYANPKPLSPAELLRKWIDTLGVDQKGFAQKASVSESRLSELINGRSALTVLMAWKLEQATSIAMETWLSTEVAYRAWEFRDKLAQYETDVSAEVASP